MGRNRNFVNQGNRLMLQGLEGVYYAPISEMDLEEIVPNFKTMNLYQLKAQIQQNFIDDYKDENGKKIEYTSQIGQRFHFRDGKTDVYTKGGLDYEVFDYLDRQIGESQRWRIETNNTQVDFKAGGKIVIGDKEYRILKVMHIMTTGTRGNKFMAMRTPNNIEKYANKLLALA